MPRLRKRYNGALSVTIRLTLMPGRDDELIDELQNTPQRQLAGKVREMMRNGVSTARFTVSDTPHDYDPDIATEL